MSYFRKKIPRNIYYPLINKLDTFLLAELCSCLEMMTLCIPKPQAKCRKLFYDHFSDNLKLQVWVLDTGMLSICKLFYTLHYSLQ
jgi:hypothetical protein